MRKVTFKLRRLVEEPMGKRRGWSMYDPILEQFMESEMKIAEVEVEDKKLPNVRTTLSKRIEKKGLKGKVEVGYRSGVLYLKKLE